MFSHVMVGSNDIEISKHFYDALFASMGGKSGRIDETGRLIYILNGAAFMVSRPLDGNDATHGNGSTIGFRMDSPEHVNAWHAAGIAAGGKSIEDPPGYRENYFGKLYCGYLRDPDNNKLCAVHRPLGPAK